MKKYTVIWSRSSEGRLAKLWSDNPKIRDEITNASRTIDQALAWVPADVGISVSDRARLIAQYALAVLYVVYELHRQVHVVNVDFWDQPRGS
jgi:hypothetical protein